VRIVAISSSANACHTSAISCAIPSVCDDNDSSLALVVVDDDDAEDDDGDGAHSGLRGNCDGHV
jgi:hypothetical protein